MTACGRGHVKTFSNRLDGMNRNKNRVPTQISGLLTDQAAADFEWQRRLQNGAYIFTQSGPFSACQHCRFLGACSRLSLQVTH
jgi:hypothetical protein